MTRQFAGIVARVWPADTPPYSLVHKPHSIIVRTNHGAREFYTWNSWQASLCQRAAIAKKPVAIDWSETPWERLIVEVDWEAS